VNCYYENDAGGKVRLIILDKASTYVNENITRYIESDNDEENEEETS
jgi:hypothetical protein